MKSTPFFVIMAGGRGERFWPASRVSLPKQFLSLIPGQQTLIQQTVERILPLADPEHIIIVTNEAYKNLVEKQLPSIPSQNLVFEPCARNTAPAIALASHLIHNRHKDALMAVLPADHLIQDTTVFQKALADAFTCAAQGENLVTIGIVPDHAETEYGYLKTDGNRVVSFVEKPDLQTAEQYLTEGNYLWNSGMFFWKTSSILKNLEHFTAETFQRTQRIAAAYDSPEATQVLKTEFARCPSVSIDYAVMEKATDVYTIPGNFGWNDVGNWTALADILPKDNDGNAAEGNIVSFLCKNNIIKSSSGRLVAAIGLSDTIVVDTEDVLLVCTKENAKEIKQVLVQLREKNTTSFL